MKMMINYQLLLSEIYKQTSIIENDSVIYRSVGNCEMFFFVELIILVFVHIN